MTLAPPPANRKGSSLANLSLTPAQRQRLTYALPPLIAGGLAWVTFMLLGQTPIIRASGLALVIVGMGMALRPMGAVLSVVGALALAFSPSFWAQMGGASNLNPLEVIAAIALAGIGALAAVLISRRPFVGAAIALIIFGGLFLTVVGTPRSLRLTTLLTAWVLYLLHDGLLLSNPRPDSPPTGQLQPYHTLGLLLLMIVGVLNDPLFALMGPAVLLGLFLTNKRLPLIYWLVVLGTLAIGAAGIARLYADSGWWGASAELVEMQGIRVPFIIADGWREPSRWLRLIDLVTTQFTLAGLLLGVLGLARLARWYPPIGVVTMVAYGAYGIFALVYFGADAPVLLLPLLMIQVMWMTYAIYTFSQWLRKSARPGHRHVHWLAPATFTLLPLLMLLRIAGIL
jgi:hypothetical protein